MPDPKLPAELDQVTGEIPAMARGLPELRAQILGLPPLSPNSLPGLRPAFLPDQQGADAVSPDPSGGTASALVGDPPGTTSGSSIIPGTVTGRTIADFAIDTILKFAANIRPPVVLAALPALPNSSYPQGSFVFLTTDSKLYRNTDGSTWSVSVDGADIIANSIVAGKIAAGAIGATELAATIVLASVLTTAQTGRRVAMSVDGIILYDTDNSILVKIPTNGDPVYIKGNLNAGTLDVTGNASLSGSGNILNANAVMSLGASINNPTSAPVLTQDWDTSFSLDPVVIAGRTLSYCATGGAGGATKVFYTRSASGVSINENLASTGAYNRQLNCSTEFPSGFLNGSAVLGTSIYVCGFTGSGIRVCKYAISNFALQATYDLLAANLPGGATSLEGIASDGTNIFLAGVDVADNTLKFAKYDSAMAIVGSIVSTGVTISGAAVRDIEVGNADAGAWRIWVVGDQFAGHVYVFNSTGTRQTNEEFDAPYDASAPTSIVGIAYGDAHGDGARFWTQPKNNDPAITKHSTWMWTTASSVYWVGYSWYDSNATGGTHESQVGPRASITMGRRKRLNVTMASLPSAGLGTDDPNNHRIYMLPNASDPGLTALKLQATVAGNSTTLTTYSAAGAADPGSNTFPSGTPAELKSGSAGWSLKGDGSATFTNIGATGGVFVGQASPVVRVYSGNATWTKPANLHHIVVEVVGGGGAGGGCVTGAAGTHSQGGGGGSGSYSRRLKLASALGATEAVTVGGGGTGVSAGTGNAGGASSFGAHATANGGGGGISSGSSSATFSGAAGGAGGAGGAGDIVSPGQPGVYGFGSAALSAAGVGAPGPWGGGGAGFSLNSQPLSTVGNGAGGWGAGGGGAACTGTGASQAGGGGGSGVVIVTEFYGP